MRTLLAAVVGFFTMKPVVQGITTTGIPLYYRTWNPNHVIGENGYIYDVRTGRRVGHPDNYRPQSPQVVERFPLTMT